MGLSSSTTVLRMRTTLQLLVLIFMLIQTRTSANFQKQSKHHPNRINTTISLTAIRQQQQQSISNCLSQSQSGLIIVHLRNTKPFIRLLNSNYFNAIPLSRYPLLITRPRTEAQIALIIRCANTFKLRICARSGGHSYLGNSLCSDIVIDLSLMNGIQFKNKNRVAIMSTGMTLGEVLLKLYARKKWFAAGVCPGVGIAGYILGGGHGPFEGRLGLACDSVIKYSLITRTGQILQVDRKHELFWALCGGGGGQFGIVTRFHVRTSNVAYFNNVVIFRFKWSYVRGTRAIHEWSKYNEHGGSVWARVEITKQNTDGQENGVFIFGTCYNVFNVAQCIRKLKQAMFYNVPGRITRVLRKVPSVLHAHAFFGPHGRWGRQAVKNANKAFLFKRFSDKGSGNTRVTQTSMLREPNSLAFWKRYVAFCADPKGLNTIPWIVCMMNKFDNAIDSPSKNRLSSFPYRAANIIQEYIIGDGTEQHKRQAYWNMKEIMKPYELGVYLNYGERFLGRKTYPSMYWGKSLNRLQKLKKKYDPNNFFSHQQPIPT